MMAENPRSNVKMNQYAPTVSPIKEVFTKPPPLNTVPKEAAVVLDSFVIEKEFKFPIVIDRDETSRSLVARESESAVVTGVNDYIIEEAEAKFNERDEDIQVVTDLFIKLEDLKDPRSPFVQGYTLVEGFLKEEPQKILAIVRSSVNRNIKIHPAILDFVEDNETFREAFRSVKPDIIQAELDQYEYMTPFNQIRALHLLHRMGMLSATFRFELPSMTKD